MHSNSPHRLLTTLRLRVPIYSRRAKQSRLPQASLTNILFATLTTFCRLYYNVEGFCLTAMSPTPTHKHSIKFFADCIRALLTPFDSSCIQFSHLPNSEIVGEDECCPRFPSRPCAVLWHVWRGGYCLGWRVWFQSKPHGYGTQAGAGDRECSRNRRRIHHHCL
jgi:hypothetical protein